MEKTWKPQAAGVLCIIAGGLGIRSGAEAVMGTATSFLPGWLGFEAMDVGLLVAGIVAIIGGIYALQRKLWPLALAGAILAIPGMWIFGILALVWVAQRRKEFVGQ